MTSTALPATGWRASLGSLEGSRWAVLIPMAVAAVLGLINLGAKSVWLDEAFAVTAARLPLLDMLNYLWRNELYGWPFYLLLHFWTALGTSETVIRLLPLLLGVGAVAATWAVGRRYGVGLRAGLILAVLPQFIEQEQNTRAYTLLALWAALTTLAYLRYAERPSWQRAAGYVATAALMVYIHPIGGLVVLAHAIHALVTAEPARRKGWLVAYAAIAISWLPMARFLLMHRDKISWISPLSVDTSVTELVLLGGGLVAAILLLAVVILGIRRDLLAAWLIVPLAGIFLVSALVQPMLQARYLVCILPAAAIICARVDLRAVAALVLACVVAVGSWYVSGSRDDWRTAVAWVESQAQPTDGILFSPGYGRLAFAYYGTAGQPIYPTVSWADSYMPGLRVFAPPPTTIAYPRVWRIDVFGIPAPPEVLTLLDGYRAVDQRNYGQNGPYITLLERIP